jgi:hypothetical protein
MGLGRINGTDRIRQIRFLRTKSIDRSNQDPENRQGFTHTQEYTGPRSGMGLGGISRIDRIT